MIKPDTKINLSYIVATYNKYPYLKQSLPRLLASLKNDEEVIVVDGASTDGSKEFFKKFALKEKHCRFISEQDKGESHALNKGILMARGKLIKQISDDDVYYYPAIAQCKKFMLDNFEVDAMGSNIAVVNMFRYSPSILVKGSLEKWFKLWIDNYCKSCFFTGLTLMMRKESAARFGLFDINYGVIDIEYVVRLTARGANIAWNTALMAVTLVNPSSGTITANYRLQKEADTVVKKYHFENLLDNRLLPRILRKVKNFIKINNPPYDINNLRKYDYFLKERISYHSKPPKKLDLLSFIFEQCDEVLMSCKENKNAKILTRA